MGNFYFLLFILLLQAKSLNFYFKSQKGKLMEQRVSSDTKLQLVQMIRAENQENRMKMQSRQKLLNYGYVEPEYFTETEKTVRPFFGLRLRLGLSFLLFLAFFYLDHSNTKIGYIGAKEIQTAINKEVDINTIDFIENFTYTLSDKEE